MSILERQQARVGGAAHDQPELPVEDNLTVRGCRQGAGAPAPHLKQVLLHVAGKFGLAIGYERAGNQLESKVGGRPWV